MKNSGKAFKRRTTAQVESDKAKIVYEPPVISAMVSCEVCRRDFKRLKGVVKPFFCSERCETAYYSEFDDDCDKDSESGENNDW
jgi:hypothetical protein